jgi:peptide-methionine (S)-S-oxide reductase
MKLTLAAAALAAAATFGKGDAMAADIPPQSLQSAVLGGGCFWCLEAVFEELQGVVAVESGYAGGDGPATYKEVCGGGTGHAEVVRVTFDPAVTGFREILAVFFAIHDPTTLNRQGADVGSQYRSAIFYADEQQKALAQEAMAKLAADGVWDDPVVTELAPLRQFFKAEDYHQDYFRNNRSQGYCQVVINPKLAKFRKEFSGKLKD